MIFENRILVKASTQDIFALYTDVENWKMWDQEVKESAIEGPFEAGSMGFLTPQKGPKAKILITNMIPNESFTILSKLPFCSLLFEHKLITKGESTEVLHRVKFTGLLSPIFGNLIGRGIKKGLPSTLKGLKSRFEK